MELGLFGAVVLIFMGVLFHFSKGGAVIVPPTVPSVPGWYADKGGDWWQLDDSGEWHLRLDRDATSLGALSPIDSYAPFAAINAPLWWPDYPNPPAVDPDFPPSVEPTPVEPPVVEPPPLEPPVVEPVEEPPVVDPPSEAPDVFTDAEIQRFLGRLGLPSANATEIKESTRRFQEASCWHVFGYPDARKAGVLVVDGDFGKLTTAHARSSIDNDFKISPHFRLSEWACRCGGKNPGCRVMQTDHKLVTILEGIRADGYTTGLTIVSGYRDPIVNKQVGGVSYSCHLSGKAADIPRRYKPSFFKNRGLSGIEYRTAHGLVTHVDVCNSRGPDWVFHE